MHSIQDSGQDSQTLQNAGRRLAWGSAALLVAGSIAFATPALAAPSAHGQAHAAHTSSHSGGHGKSGVHLSKPNGYQAQSDPDGMDNGGVDQPGGTGGVDTTSQDGNNGSGNDADCEDDNRGVGVPGHCKDRTSSSSSDEGTGSTGSAEKPAEGDQADETDQPDQADQADQADQEEASAPAADQAVSTAATQVGDAGAVLTTSFGQALVSAPEASAPQAAPASGQTAAAAAAAAPESGALAGVLPNTGAGQALLGLTTLALMLLALGGGLLRRTRRSVRIER